MKRWSGERGRGGYWPRCAYELAFTDQRGHEAGHGSRGGQPSRRGTQGEKNNCLALAYLIAERRLGLRRSSAEAGCWAIRGLAALSG